MDMGVSKNRGTPRWMVYMENPIKMDDLGVPLFLEIPISWMAIRFQVDLFGLKVLHLANRWCLGLGP